MRSGSQKIYVLVILGLIDFGFIFMHLKAYHRDGV